MSQIYCAECGYANEQLLTELKFCGNCGKSLKSYYGDASRPVYKPIPKEIPKKQVEDDDDDEENGMPTELPEVKEINLSVEKEEKRLSFEKVGDVMGTPGCPVGPRPKYTKKMLKEEFKNLAKRKK
jgi:hypothetical protein